MEFRYGVGGGKVPAIPGSMWGKVAQEGEGEGNDEEIEVVSFGFCAYIYRSL